MRLDKFLCQMNMGSRSDVKELIRKKQVSVNGVIVSSPDHQIEETKDIILCKGQKLYYKPFVYYMMNKPQGVVSATTDRREKTVIDLIRPKLPEQDRKRNLIPVGRLDKDTVGLLLLTDDGALAHSLLSPKRHVCKTYEVKLAKPLTQQDISRLEQGVDISETAPPAEKDDLRRQPTFPARVLVLEENTIRLSIREGRFHQVKRMLQAVGNEVTALRRIRFGALDIDPCLAPGAFRELTAAEAEWLNYAQHQPTGHAAVMKDVHTVFLRSQVLTLQTDLKGMRTRENAANFAADCIKRGVRIQESSFASTAKLLDIIRAKNISSDQCIAFVNSTTELIAAKDAGMRVCMIADTPRQDSSVADYYFKDYDEILF